MASEQFSIFEFSDSQYRITKPIRLIEFFAGIGAQSKALEVLGANFENYKIAEWSKESIKAYTYIHYYEEIKNCTDKEIINLQGISRDYNAPMTDEQLNRLKDDEKILLSNCIKISHNLVDISSVKGEDLNIVDTDKYEYVLTYSFPCQDLSLAGKLAGMEENSGTRSSLLWQVCRILKECKEKPQILIMENVPEVIGTNNRSSFNKWCKELENMGYANYWDILNAKDYYIPQSRRRCFMVSILGKENTFAFPNRIKPKYYLLDFLDKNVDEKYYLSDEKIKKVESWSGYENPLNDIEPNRICSTLTTHCGKDSNGMQLVLVEKDSSMKKELCNKLIESGKVKEGDMITHSYTNNRLEKIDEDNFKTDNENNICKTLTTRCDCLGVVVNDYKYLGTYEYNKSDKFQRYKSRFEPNKKFSNTILASGNNNGVVVLGNYSPSGHNASRIVDSKGIASTVMENHGTITAVVVNEPKVIGGIGEKKSNGGTQYYLQDRVYDNKIATSICTSFNPYYLSNNLRIRKLTPCECYKLMGFTTDDYNKCAEIQSNATIYHQAGDSIVITCLIAIFGKLLGVDYEKVIKNYVENEILKWF